MYVLELNQSLFLF